MKLTPILAAAVAALPSALAWGAAGHEIVATIAQIHLHPHVRDRLCSVLPPAAHCHLAPVAAWADAVRRRYPETGPMHYVNPKYDHPADHCEFGENGWINEDVNVLTAILNKTQVLIDNPNDIDLRFLIHFIGDLHQPLHLTGRDKGGNGAMFRFEGRARNLHSVWDSGIITKNIRELANYTSPLPSKQIEDALPGAIFDSYVRWIVWEGIRQWWRDDLEDWLACPASGDPYPHSSLGSYPADVRTQAVAPRGGLVEDALGLAQTALDYMPNSVHSLLGPLIPAPARLTEGFNQKLLSNTPQALTAAGEEFKQPACPYTWAKNIHHLNCDVAWPTEYTGGGPLIELDTDKYIGEISRQKTMEGLLAMGGLRLAKVLNEVFGGGNATATSLYMTY